MRVAIVVAVACLSAVGLCAGQDAKASITKYTNIPAQELAPALKTLAHERGFQVVFRSEVVGAKRTHGAVGDLTTTEALTRLLDGTNLVYSYLDEKTVTILPVNSNNKLDGQGPSAGNSQHCSGLSSAKLDYATSLNQTGSGSTAINWTGSEGASDCVESYSQENQVLATRIASAEGGPVQNSDGKSNLKMKSTDSAQLEEVVVTAQKRAETVNNTPLAVTALGMTQLQDAGVKTVSNLTSSIPNLQIHTLGQNDFVGITIRGVSNLTPYAEGNPAVSTYIDGIYVDPPVGFSNALHDLERVEVLRGPQGTLYGRNATGGNLNIITASPKPSFDASFDVSYGNYNDVMTHAMVNVPVSDTLAVRVAFMAHRSDGYFGTNGTTYKNYGASEDVGLRLTGLWTPTESFKWRLSLDGFQSNGAPPGISIQTGANQMPSNGLSPYHQPYYADPEPSNYIRNATVRSRMDLRLTDNLSLAYVAGYQQVLWAYVWGTTGQPGAPAIGSPAMIAAARQSDASTQGHELNLILDTEKLKNVVGATYFGGSLGNGYQLSVPYINYSVRMLTIMDVDKESWGAFDQATWSPITDLRLTAGVRYSHDRQLQPAYHQLSCSGVVTLEQVNLLTTTSPQCAAPFGVVTTPRAGGSWSKASWKVGVDYDLTDAALTYASVTSGYKQGGVQPGLPASFPNTYAPETMLSYEAGTKLRLLDRTLNVRVAGFFEDYRDIQTARLDFDSAGLPYFVTANAGGSHNYGVEIESEWRPTATDYLSAFFTWLHARYTKFDNAVDPRTNTIIPSLAGNQLPNAPETSVRLEYRHDFSLPNGGTLTPQVTYYWQSKSYSNPINVDVYGIRSYSNSDLQLTYAGAEEHWQIAAYVRNVENHAIRNSEFTFLGNIYSDFGPPRMYGVRLSYRY